MSFSRISPTKTISPIYQVGIPDYQFQYYQAEQLKSNWCWAASIQMVLRYYGVSKYQAQIAVDTCGTDFYGHVNDCGAIVPDITEELNLCGLDNNHEYYCANAKPVFGRLDAHLLVNRLNAGRPIILAYKHSQGGHAVVVTGATYQWVNNVLTIRSITYYDPWPSPRNIRNNGRVVTRNTRSLANSTIAIWVPSVDVTDNFGAFWLD